jgi:hypothetical protein
VRTVSQITKEIQYIREKLADIQLGIQHGEYERYKEYGFEKRPDKQWFIDVYEAYESTLQTCIKAINMEIPIVDVDIEFPPEMLCYTSKVWDKETKVQAQEQARYYGLRFVLGDMDWFEREMVVSQSLLSR